MAGTDDPRRPFGTSASNRTEGARSGAAIKAGIKRVKAGKQTSGNMIRGFQNRGDAAGSDRFVNGVEKLPKSNTPIMRRGQTASGG